MKKKVIGLLLAFCIAVQQTVLCGTDVIYATTVSDNQISLPELTDNGEEEPLTYRDIPDEEIPDVTGVLYDETQSEAEPYRIEAWREEELPAAYRSDREGFVPDFRQQGAFGVCWAFSALAACETNMIKKGLAGTDIDLSESHLAYYFYNKESSVSDMLGGTAGDYNRNEKKSYLSVGGNGAFTMWHLAGWHGPASEADEAYDFTYDTLLKNKVVDSGEGTTSSYKLPQDREAVYGRDVSHVQNVYIVNTADREAMKHVIQENGSVATGYFSSDAYDNFLQGKYSYGEDGELDEGNYYCTEEKGTNHAIQIIGWDDNYDRSLFWQEPEENGAWLIRNSWGGESDKKAQSGLFWISYEDLGLGKTAFAYDMEAADNYDNIYQYDGASGYKSQAVSGAANLFTASANGEADEEISAVSVGVSGTNTEYTVKIYLYPDRFDWENAAESKSYRLEDGYLAMTQTGSLGYSGYHTVRLEEPVVVSAGQKYAVVFEFAKPTKVFYDTTYQNGDWISFTADSGSGQSYQKNGSGSPAEDFAEVSGMKNFVYRIKAFTDNLTTQSKIEVGDSQTVRVGETSTVSCNLIDLTGDIVWTSSDEAVASVEDGIVTGVAEGTAVIRADCKAREGFCAVTVLPRQTQEGESGTPPIKTEKPSGEKPDTGENKPQIGTVHTVGTNRYEILSDSTVSCKGSTLRKSKIKKVTIPATVKIQGRTYRVTAIGKKAFYNCKNLKKITIKTTSLKMVGASAFKKIHKGAVIKVPKSKKTKYKKLIKKRCDKGAVIK